MLHRLSWNREPPSASREVTIDGDFLRAEARDAVRQFFRPVTAPFQIVREHLPEFAKAEEKRKPSARR